MAGNILQEAVAGQCFGHGFRFYFTASLSSRGLALHWDGTISLGNILTIIFGAGPVFYIALKTYWLLKEYPPHKHLNGHIIYPTGVTPQEWRGRDK
jgi:hypothetical protein